MIHKAVGKTYANSKNKPFKYILTIESEKGDTTTLRFKTKPEMILSLLEYSEKNQNSVISWREKP